MWRERNSNDIRFLCSKYIFEKSSFKRWLISGGERWRFRSFQTLQFQIDNNTRGSDIAILGLYIITWTHSCRRVMRKKISYITFYLFDAKDAFDFFFSFHTLSNKILFRTRITRIYESVFFFHFKSIVLNGTKRTCVLTCTISGRTVLGALSYRHFWHTRFFLYTTREKIYQKPNYSNNKASSSNNSHDIVHI